MTLNPLGISEDERWLLTELVDFGMSLFEIAQELRNAHEGSCDSEINRLSEDLIVGLQARNLARLYKIELHRTKQFTYEELDIVELTDQEIAEHISNPQNWHQKLPTGDNDKLFELRTTEIGEKVLDQIFEVYK